MGNIQREHSGYKEWKPLKNTWQFEGEDLILGLKLKLGLSCG